MAVIDIVSIIVGVIVIGGMIAICIILENKDKLKHNLYNILLNLTNYVSEAESMFAKGQGDAKMKYVLSRVKVDCIENHIKLTEEKIKAYIERILTTPQKTIQHAPVNAINELAQLQQNQVNKGVQNGTVRTNGQSN